MKATAHVMPDYTGWSKKELRAALGLRDFDIADLEEMWADAKVARANAEGELFDLRSRLDGTLSIDKEALARIVELAGGLEVAPEHLWPGDQMLVSPRTVHTVIAPGRAPDPEAHIVVFTDGSTEVIPADTSLLIKRRNTDA